MPPEVDRIVKWLTEDPTGRVVGCAAVGLLAILALVALFRMTRWAVGHRNGLVGGAVLIGLAYYGAIYVLNLGPAGWAVALFLAFGAFVAFALYLTHAH